MHITNSPLKLPVKAHTLTAHSKVITLCVAFPNICSKIQAQKNEFLYGLGNMTGAYVAFFEEPPAQLGKAVIGSNRKSVGHPPGLQLANEATNMEISGTYIHTK
eukprot:Platyproteum_vivax@DN7693_c3_g2_i7.p1